MPVKYFARVSVIETIVLLKTEFDQSIHKDLLQFYQVKCPDKLLINKHFKKYIEIYRLINQCLDELNNDALKKIQHWQLQHNLKTSVSQHSLA